MIGLPSIFVECRNGHRNEMIVPPWWFSITTEEFTCRECGEPITAMTFGRIIDENRADLLSGMEREEEKNV